MRPINSIFTKVVAVIPAAGIGSRMLSKIPKQYIKIQGCTILEHSIKFLLIHSSIKKVIIVLHKKDKFFYKLPISTHPRVFSVIGGGFRINSVLSGLLVIRDTEWVIIHDAVRPCLNFNDLNKIINIIKYSTFGGILATPVVNTIKYSINNLNVLCTINRNKLWNALTPQCFPLKLLLSCLKKIIKKGIYITDEASAMEYFGYYPELVRGNSRNIKVTYKEDIDLVDFYLKQQYCKRTYL
ncbi:MAG: 2-C-methyl-D-erythritol 4-phosphate cytidylyltransferase [Buchnera aphidicola (Nurudea yanoniella)]